MLTPRNHLIGLTAALIVVALAAAAPAASAGGRRTIGDSGGGEKNPRVLPPGSSSFGKTYGEWSAVWWQWAFSFRTDAHPLLETAGCDAGQTGQVWFLGGSFVNTTVVRECSVPAGRAIFFPVLNTECSTFEGPPFHGDNEAELRACAAAVTNSGMFATIDGVAVKTLGSYRVQSPLYHFSAPDGGLFGGPVTDAQSISDGVWLMLTPMSVGKHTIHFGGTQTITGSPPLTLDVTYHLTVAGPVGAESATDVKPTTWGKLKAIYR
jgi:hypothetical protein